MKKGILYLIPTPIGNMEDMTLRSIRILKEVDVLFCEDTRETGLLLSHLGIKTKLVSNHNFNEKQNTDKIIEYLSENKIVGLVSDRGTPVISDPGWEMVREASKFGYEVIPLPGANALIPALIASGIESTPFMFYGFLSNKEEKRKKELESLKDFRHTIIFYESPHRIEKTVQNIYEILGDRNMNISREISKKFEEHIRGKVSEVIEKIKNVKGEIVIVLEGNKENKDFTLEEIKKHVNYYLKESDSLNDAIKRVAKEFGLNKNEIYKKYHNL